MEIINIILHIFGVIFSTYFYNLCYIKLNNHKISFNTQTIMTIFITSFLILINNSYNNLWLKFVITFIIFCINFKILYKDDMKQIITSYIFIYIIMIVTEIILTNIFLKIGFINNSNTKLYTFFKFLLSIIIAIMEYLIISINIVKINSRKLINFLIENINTLNIAYLSLIVCAILAKLNIDNFTDKESIKLIIVLFVIFIILFSIIIKLKSEEDFLKRSNKKLMEFNERYGQFLDDYKIYKHNIKNKLVGMKTFGNKKINALIDDLLDEETTFSIKNNNLYSIPNGIKGIVAEKLYNTKINVLIDNKIKNDPFLSLKPKEFNSISESIGICLDNAIEASLETDNPTVVLNLYEDKEYIYIKTGNNFRNNIDIDNIGNKYYSTKNRNSGLGLFSIRQNKIIKEKINIINDFYYIELKIKKHAN